MAWNEALRCDGFVGVAGAWTALGGFVAAVLMCVCLVVCVPTKMGNLRGQYTHSPDGLTYLEIDPTYCDMLVVDGEPWPGGRVQVRPGAHELECIHKCPECPPCKDCPGGVTYGFNVPPETTYAFDYWGP